MNIYEKPNFTIDSDIIIEEIDSVLITHTPSKKWKYKQRPFEIDTIFYVVKGEYYVYLENNKFHMKENSVLFLPRGIKYESESISETLIFQGIYFKSRADKPTDFYHTYQYIPDCKNLHNKFENIYKLFESNQFAKKILAKKSLYDILSHLLQKKMYAESDFSNYYIIKNAVDYLETNYTKNDISITFLANLCNITPTYFGNVFKKIFRQTPKEYIIDMRMEKAKEYLMYSSFSMNEISDQLGYSNPAYFSSAFKNKYGIAPTAFKKKYN